MYFVHNMYVDNYYIYYILHLLSFQLLNIYVVNNIFGFSLFLPDTNNRLTLNIKLKKYLNIYILIATFIHTFQLISVKFTLYLFIYTHSTRKHIFLLEQNKKSNNNESIIFKKHNS